jgi:hypothetical protein
VGGEVDAGVGAAVPPAVVVVTVEDEAGDRGSSELRAGRRDATPMAARCESTKTPLTSGPAAWLTRWGSAGARNSVIGVPRAERVGFVARVQADLARCLV